MKDIKRRLAFILIDGLGDVSVPRFQHQTTLQVAVTLNLDAITSAGVNAGVTLHIVLYWDTTPGCITEAEEHLSRWVLDWPWTLETLHSRLTLALLSKLLCG